MATHSSILAWRIAWTEEPGGRESTGLHSIRHDQATAHRQHDVKTDLTHVCRVTNTLASVSKTEAQARLSLFRPCKLLPVGL